ncbi:MAG: hypothetical protein GF411_16885 [Candidatus Lokiarchaeota archaeon]|nr:hypothetical protein [Candidatus Lokiarchaeota archaeon]
MILVELTMTVKGYLTKGLVMLILLCMCTAYIPSVHSANSIPLSNHALSYEEHIPFSINDDLDFTSHGFSGSGSVEDPYVIENLRISGTICISIRNIDSHYVIRNCYLIGGGSNAALLMTNTRNGIVQDCIVVGNPRYGIELSGVEEFSIINSSFHNGNSGIRMSSSRNCTAIKCTTSNNAKGIDISGGQNSTVTQCKIYGNSLSGIELDGFSEGHLVFNNSIGWNGGFDDIHPLNNAEDDGTWNRWDDGIAQGNRWSNLQQTDEHQIDGTAGSRDHFPVTLLDLDFPIIEPSSDITIEYETRGNTVSWNASDDFPYSYSLSLDGNEPQIMPWHGRTISVDIDNLSPGVHNITLEVRDARGNVDQDTVDISVIPGLIGGMGTPIVVMASILSGISVIVVILLIKKF